VTRLDDFSPFGRLFFLVFFITEIAQIFGQLFATVKVMHYFDDVCFGLHFGRCFFKNSFGHPGHPKSKNNFLPPKN
jgi:hypothetical protein